MKIKDTVEIEDTELLSEIKKVKNRPIKTAGVTPAQSSRESTVNR